jgi:hypothetical protein
LSARAHVRQLDRGIETPGREQRRHPVSSAAPVRLGTQTSAILALQRHAGNRATTAFLQSRPPSSAPVAGQTTAPTLQRGVFSFIGDVLTGAASYVADVGRGFKRSAKGLRVWDDEALVKMHEENASAARLFGRLVSDPFGTIEKAILAAAGGFGAFTALPGPLKDKATAKFKDAAPSMVQKIVAKVVGKVLAQKLFVAIANRILMSGVVKKLLAKLGASVAVSKTGVGIPLAVFSSLGLIEKASGAADRLEEKFPAVYRRLKAEDLHMLWFMVEPHVPAIMAQVHATIDEYIDRTQPDGRVLIDAGPNRTPIDAGPEQRIPIRTGGSEPRRVPIRSGGGGG